MRINIAGRWEEWTPERLAEAKRRAEAWHEHEEQKDWDAAWLNQWLASTHLVLLACIEKILREPTGRMEIGRRCPECGATCPPLYGRWGRFYRCRCGWKAGASKAERVAEPVYEERPRAIAYNAFGIPYITLDDPAPAPTIGELLGIQERS